MIAQYGLGFIAGVLSLLAPCVLPLIPIIFGSAVQSSKFAPIANAIGLTFSFTMVGILTSLFASSFDVDVIQKLGAVILLVVGVIFVIPKLKDGFVNKMSFIGNTGHKLQGKIKGNGLVSHFLMGSVLGLIWGPCSGPTLAFAFGIATQAGQALHASLIFFFFGLGAGLGLVALGFLLKRFSHLTGALIKHNKTVNYLTGFSSIAIGILILSGQLLVVEEAILNILPQWLVELPTSF